MCCYAQHDGWSTRAWNEEESSSFYEVVQEQPWERARDNAARKVDDEDSYFLENASLANLDNDVVDLEFKKRMEQASFKTWKNRIVQRRWKDLYDSEAHLNLQTAVKEHLYIQAHGSLKGAHNLAKFDPLA